jgi:hypothetical protein
MPGHPTGKSCLSCESKKLPHEIKERRPTPKELGRMSSADMTMSGCMTISYCTGCQAESQIMIQADLGM